jgi:hypothetical protein
MVNSGHGNYGTRVESASLKFNDDVELLSNTEFTSTSNWISDIGWQECSGVSGYQPCVNIVTPPTTTTIPVNNGPYQLGLDMVWGMANEGWDLSLSAPGGGTFTNVVFASYGNPTGVDGQYSQGWCHATNSIQKVSEVFIGNSSGTIASGNGIFGDPCGGTYKSLYVVLQYTGGLPNTTTTTTPPPPPSCGPYENITVTGSLNGGEVWGSGPYTDDSDMNVAAVHAGLVEPGETKTLVPENVSYHLSYPGSTRNGVTTTDWLFGWCGYDLSVLTPPTTTTTTITSTIAIPQTTTTTVQEKQEETKTTTTTTTTSSIVQTTTSIEEIIAQQATTTTISTTTTTPQVIVPTATSIAQTTTTLPSTTTTTSIPSATTTTVELVSKEEKINDLINNPNTEDAVDLINSSSLNKEQIQEIISAVLEENISQEDAQILATSPQILQSINGEQASEVFAAVNTSQLTEEAKFEITAAVQEAPEEVRNAFEKEINIYADGFDDYVPVGSNIDVASRRTLLAATTVLASAAAMAAANGASGPKSGGPSSGGPSGSGSGPTGGENNAARKKEEEGSEDEEETPEIEGPDGDGGDEEFTRNSIFKYTEGTMEKRFSPLGFIKKFAKETASLAFTISGTVIVFATLSGDTRKITVIATSCAFFVHYLYVMLSNDE